jgi:hypothetical protein
VTTSTRGTSGSGIGRVALPSDLRLVQVLGGPAGVITVIAVLLGVLGMAGEYRHQTITTTFLASPRRRDVVLAKLVAHAITGALIGLTSLAVSASIAVPWLTASGVDVHLDGRGLRLAAGLVVSTALYASLGVSIGALLRNQTAAAAVVLIWLLAIEGIIGDLLHGGRHLRRLRRRFRRRGGPPHHRPRHHLSGPHRTGPPSTSRP